MITMAATFALASLIVTLVTHACAHRGLSRRPLPGSLHPGVTLLKPLCGLDDDLYENLVSFARLDYPRYQIVFGAASPDDPALEVARRVQAEHPHVDIAIVAGASALGRNPKVTNLASLSRRATHSFWLISDSNVRVEPGYLKAMVPEVLQPDVGLVISTFCGRGERSFGAFLENLQLNTWILGSMWGMQILTGQGCGMGKSMLFHRRILERIGGWSALEDVLAEDFVFGRRVVAEGLRVHTSHHRITTVNTHWSLDRFLNRHVRWSTLRRHISPVAYLGEPLLNPLIGAGVLASVGAPLPALGIVAVKLASDTLLLQRVLGRWPRARHLGAMVVKDALLAGVWAVGLTRRRVWWRGTWLRIGAGSVISAAEPEVLAPCRQPTVASAG